MLDKETLWTDPSKMGQRPASNFKIEVFPDPLGPINTVCYPSLICSIIGSFSNSSPLGDIKGTL